MAKFSGTTTSDEVVSALSDHIKGRTFVLTGAGEPSIGSQMATALARGSPAHIVVASRTRSRVEPVFARIAADAAAAGRAPPRTTFVRVELTDLASVRAAAADVLAAAPAVDVLVNCAGVMALKDYEVDGNGVEAQLSANHVGHFLLTNLLAPALLLAAAADKARGDVGGGARVVNLTSSGHRTSAFRFDDWNFSGGAAYDPWTAYGQAKTANVLFAYGLGKRLAGRGVTATAAHPGYNSDTRLAAHLTWDDFASIEAVTKRNTGKDWVWEEPGVKTMEQIAATPLVAALDPELPARSPAYLVNGNVEPCAEHACNPEAVEKLWKLSEELVQQEFSY